MADSIVRSCIECGAALAKKPGPGRWPKRCITCRPDVVRKSQPPLQLVCDHCDETFTVHVGPGPRHRKFCSPACRQAKWQADEAYQADQREKNRIRSAAQYEPVAHLRKPCAFCGALFEPTRKNALYCKDRTCRARRTTAKAVQRDPDYHRRRNARYRGKPLDEVQRLGAAFDCAWCGAHQIPSVTCAPHASKFCPGQSCKRSWHGSGGLSLAEVKRLKAQERLNRAAIGTAGSRNYLASRCPRCGEQAITPYHPLAAGYCSSRCSSRDNKDRRRAREAGAAITPGKRYEVYERDNWTCYICEYEVDRDADPGSNWAPSVDHVVALVNGGNHGLDNWRCAHRWCNSLKRDLPLADVA